MDTSTLITLTDAAERLGRSKQLVSRWVQQGRIPAVYIAGRPYIKLADCKEPEKLPGGRKPQK